jgi:hypothetical protein
MADRQNFSTDYWDEKSTRTGIQLKEKPREPRAAWNRAKPTYTGHGGETQHYGLKFWILLVFFATALVLFSLITNILIKKDNKESGIVTLSVRTIYFTLELNC